MNKFQIQIRMDQVEFCKQVARNQLNHSKSKSQDVEMVQETLKSMQQSSENKSGPKVALCFFSGIKEQCPQNEDELPFQRSQFGPSKKAMRCYYEECRLKVVTSGGSEFVNNVRHKISAVYPLEDGLLIKAIFNADLYSFELSGFHHTGGSQGSNWNAQRAKQSTQETYVYLSLIGHPLDDAIPIAIHNSDNQMINSSASLVHVNPVLPFTVVYEQNSNEIKFCLIKRIDRNNDLGAIAGVMHADADSDQAADAQMRCIDQDSRGAKQQSFSLPSLLGTSKIILQTIFTIQESQKPQHVIVSQGLASSDEMIVALYFKQLKQVHTYSCDLSQTGLIFRKVMVYQDVQVMTEINFSGQLLKDGIKIASQYLISNLVTPKNQMYFEDEENDHGNKEMEIFKKRLSFFSKDMVLLSRDHSFISIYKGGYTLLHQISLAEHLQKLGYPQNVKNIWWSPTAPCTLQVDLYTHKTIGLEICLHTNSFLISSILKVLKHLLPPETFAKFLQDTVYLLTSKITEDKFGVFGDMLLSLIANKEVKMLCKETTDFQKFLNSQNESTQLQQERPNSSKILKVASVGSKIKSLSKEQLSSVEKRVATISVSSSVIKNSPTKYQSSFSQVKTPTSSKIQVKKVSNPKPVENASSSKVQEFSKAFMLPNAFELMLKSDFSKKQGNLLGNFISEAKNLEHTIESSLQKTATQEDNKPAKPRPTAIRNNFINKSISPEKKPTKSLAKPQEVDQVQFQTTSRDILQHSEKLFEILHLMYEDIKLSKLSFTIEGPKLRKFLFAMALILPKSKSQQLLGHLVYYSAEDQSLKTTFQDEIKLQFNGKTLVVTNQSIQQVPRILNWITQMLQKPKEVLLKYPVFFENSRIVCRIYELISQHHQSYFLQLNNQNALEDFSSHKHFSTAEQVCFVFAASLINCERMENKRLTQGSIQDYIMLQGSNSPLSGLHLFEKVLYCLKEERFSMEEIKQLPDLVSLPMVEIIRYTRLFQQEIQTVPMWPLSLYRLIRREDIINNLKISDRPTGTLTVQNQHAQEGFIEKNSSLKRRGSKNFAFSRSNTNVFNDQQEVKMAQKFQNQYVQELIGADNVQDQDGPGVGKGESQKDSQISEFLKNRFGKDTRYKEAEYLLSSQVDMVLKLDSLLQGGQADQIALSEEEKKRRQQLQLDKLFSRHLSKCIGRGALTLGTQETLPTETLLIPKISHTGLIISANDQGSEGQFAQPVSVNIDGREQREIVQWPNFHNGVATALKISQSGFKRNLNQSDQTNNNNLNHARDWIMYHKPSEPKNEHGGFLLGIGLLGQLDSLRPTDLYQHLKSAHDSTTIGILLGRAASHIGKMDDADSRTMCLHIPALLPQNLSVEISLSVQSAAVIGAGLLYQSTQNRLITEMLLSQIARKPTTDKVIEREGYALASGIALGFVNLAKNNDAKPIQRASPTTDDREHKNPFSTVGLQFSELTDLKLDERLIRFIEGGKKMPLPRSMMQTAQYQEQNKSSAIKENDMVNVYITSSGALLALTLIHLKSNNAVIANRLQIPESFYAMEFVRPATLLQKVLCRNLIMWDGIKPNEDWVLNQIPAIIRQIFESDMDAIDKEFSKRCNSKDIDFATVSLCYVNILAGATLSVGLRYAGTGNTQAKQLIEKQIAFFRKQLKVVPGTQGLGGPIQTNTTAQTKNQVDKTTVETCLCVLALALGIVMAGKCDISSFRIMRVLRKRFELEMHYGYNMAINMAIGFLFLGSGAYTFSRSNEAIAALLCATYPIFPQNPSDNRFHLQALRHFYVLAIETRLIQARDTDTGNFVNIEVQVTLEDDATQEVKTVFHHTPDIINGKILNVEVKNNLDYHDVFLTIAEPDITENFMQVDIQTRGNQSQFEQTALQRVIYVKRKNYVEKIEKADLTQNLLARAVLSHNCFDSATINWMESNVQIVLESLQKIKDPSIETFIRIFTSTILKDSKQLQIKPISELNLSQGVNNIQDIMMCQQNETKFENFIQLQALLVELESQLLETSEFNVFKQSFTTLMALKECFTDDKISSLPVFLKMVSQLEANTDDEMLLSAYLTFMHKSKQQGLFLKNKRDILEKSLLDALESQKRHLEIDMQALKSYVASLGEGFIVDLTPQLSQFTKLLDPCTLQAIKCFLMQVMQEAASFDPSSTDSYLSAMRDNKGLTQSEIVIHEMVKESLRHVLTYSSKPLSDDMIDQAILPGILQTF